MKRISVFLLALMVMGFMTSYAFAGSYSTTGGDTMTIDASGIPGADNLTFNPSPRVNMTGRSSAMGFAHNGVHQQALETEGGKAYGMASDTNRVFFVSVAADGSALVAVTTSNSDEFITNQSDYEPMQ